MNRIRQIEALLLRSRRLPWLVLAVVLLSLATVIFLAVRPIRDSIREQMVHREGDVLRAVVTARLENMTTEGEADDLADPMSQLAALLSISRLEGVTMGIRLFDDEGAFVLSVPPLLMEQELPDPFRAQLLHLDPVCRFQPQALLSDQFYPETVNDVEDPVRAPLVEVYIPLHVSGSSAPLGVAEFVMDGRPVVAEFQRLDRRLWYQGTAVFLVAGAAVSLVLGWAFRRLHRLHQQLAERTESLLQANAELALAARTTALGAITSHLVHGLRSPMAGLQNLVAAGRQEEGAPAPEDWEQAAASVRRMQNLMAEVLHVLQEHPKSDQYRISLSELVDQVCRRVASLARERDVHFRVECSATGWLDNRAANLISLILVNLVENALQATPAGQGVSLTVVRRRGEVACQVADQGSGVPEALRAMIFRPVISTKEGGSGLGLAISRQLAQHLGIDLRLASNGPAGAVFEVRLPEAMIATEEVLDQDLAAVIGRSSTET